MLVNCWIEPQSNAFQAVVEENQLSQVQILCTSLQFGIQKGFTYFINDFHESFLFTKVQQYVFMLKDMRHRCDARIVFAVTVFLTLLKKKYILQYFSHQDDLLIWNMSFSIGKKLKLFSLQIKSDLLSIISGTWNRPPCYSNKRLPFCPITC